MALPRQPAGVCSPAAIDAKVGMIPLSRRRFELWVPPRDERSGSNVSSLAGIHGSNEWYMVMPETLSDRAAAARGRASQARRLSKTLTNAADYARMSQYAATLEAKADEMESRLVRVKPSPDPACLRVRQPRKVAR